jgi:hypothetical protein
MTYIPPANGGRINATISGNTAGAGALISTGTMTLAGGNNITLSQNGNAITISGAAGGGAGFSAGMSNIGNTSGMTGMASNQLVLAGGNNVTLSQSTSPGGNTVSFAAGVNLSAGTTSNNLQNMIFSNSNGVSFGLDGSTMTASVAAAGGGGEITLSRWQNMDRGTSAVMAFPYNTLFIQRLNQENDLFAGNMTVNTVLMNVSGSASTGASSTQTMAANTMSLSLGVYIPVASDNTVLTLINSASTTFGSNATVSVYPYNYGNRWLSIHSSQWSSSPVFTQGGDYVFGVLVRSSGATTARSFIGQSYMNSHQRSGYFGASVTTGHTSMPHGNYWNAMYSATTAALPGAISGGQVNRNNATAVFIPHIIFNNQYTY